MTSRVKKIVTEKSLWSNNKSDKILFVYCKSDNFHGAMSRRKQAKPRSLKSKSIFDSFSFELLEFPFAKGEEIRK